MFGGMMSFDPSEYSVRQIPFGEAKPLIVAGHYTHSLTKGRYCFGMFRGEGGILGGEGLIGAAVFGQPSGRNVAASIWADGDERNTLELLRFFVLDVTGKNAESWFLSRAIKQLPREVKVLVAYSAPGVGHYGACYQAANWQYIGPSKSGQNYFYLDRNGMYVNKRIPWQLGPRSGRPWLAEKDAAKILHLRRVEEGRKYAYVYVRARGVVLKREVQPFPKPGFLARLSEADTA